MGTIDDLKGLLDRNGDGELSLDDAKAVVKQARRLQRETLKRYDGWDGSKFVRGLNPLNAAWWGKTFNIIYRNLIVFLIIGALVFGIGYTKGWDSRPLNFGERERRTVIDFVIDRPGPHQIVIETDGAGYLDGKPLTQGMVEGLKPYGIHIKPKLAMFAGSGGVRAGGAIELAHFHRFNLDILYAVPDFFGVGVSYDLYFDESAVKITNSHIGIGIMGSPSGGAGPFIYYAVAV